MKCKERKKLKKRKEKEQKWKGNPNMQDLRRD